MTQKSIVFRHAGGSAGGHNAHACAVVGPNQEGELLRSPSCSKIVLGGTDEKMRGMEGNSSSQPRCQGSRGVPGLLGLLLELLR